MVDQPRSLSGASVAADVPQTTTLRIQRRRLESRREATVIVSVESVELGACVADANAVRSPVVLRACTCHHCPSTAATCCLQVTISLPAAICAVLSDTRWLGRCSQSLRSS